MKNKKFTKKAYRDWLGNQRTSRTFGNHMGSRCMGHCFVLENGIDTEVSHTVDELNTLSGGWFTEFFNFHTANDAGTIYKDMCRWTKKK